jgi:hypothetical protein
MCFLPRFFFPLNSSSLVWSVQSGHVSSRLMRVVLMMPAAGMGACFGKSLRRALVSMAAAGLQAGSKRTAVRLNLGLQDAA